MDQATFYQLDDEIEHCSLARRPLDIEFVEQMAAKLPDGLPRFQQIPDTSADIIHAVIFAGIDVEHHAIVAERRIYDVSVSRQHRLKRYHHDLPLGASA